MKEKLKISINSISEMIQAILKSSEDINKKAQNFLSTSEEMSSSSEEVANAIQEVAKGSCVQSDNLMEIKAIIDELGKSINGIDEITNTINSIADQTNLLALNAAIEAVRAGESGKGFAGVADEIRKLAEQSKASSEEISSVIGEISNETSQVVATTDNVKNDLKEQISIIQISIQSFKCIINSIEKIIPKISNVNTSSIKLNQNKNVIV